MAVTVRHAALIAAFILAAVAAFAYGTPDGAVAALSATDAGSAGSVIWD